MIPAHRKRVAIKMIPAIWIERLNCEASEWFEKFRSFTCNSN